MLYSIYFVYTANVYKNVSNIHEYTFLPIKIFKTYCYTHLGNDGNMRSNIHQDISRSEDITITRHAKCCLKLVFD